MIKFNTERTVYEKAQITIDSSSTTFIAQLPEDEQQIVKVALVSTLCYVMDANSAKFAEVIDNAMAGRLVDLEDDIDIVYITAEERTKLTLTNSDKMVDCQLSPTIRFRADQIKAMHEVIKCANDETIYAIWITEVPDEPDDEDFESIADDDESYNEVIDLFVKLVGRKGYRA